MKVILSAIVALLLLAQPSHGQDQDNIERGQVAVNMFKSVCFFMQGKPDERINFLDEKFVKHDDPEKKKKFLRYGGVEDGDVWIAAFPKGTFAIVVGKNNNCNVIAQKADRPTVHEGLKVFREEAAKNLSGVSIKDISSQPEDSVVDSTGFEVIAPNGTITMVVLGSTPKASADNKPDAIITLAVSK